jgi:hypothetical protein
LVTARKAPKLVTSNLYLFEQMAFCLIVDFENKNDNSLIEMHPDVLERLNLFRGDLATIAANEKETGTPVYEYE